MTNIKQERKMKMWKELWRVQMKLVDNKKVTCGGKFVDFNYRKFYFEIDLLSTDGCSIRPTYFACDSLETLKSSIKWVLSNTRISEVIAFIKDKYPKTFRSAESVDYSL